MAEEFLEQVGVPTLLIVGGLDDVVIELNKQALARLEGRKELQIVPGATHLFEEPGALDQVSQLAKAWFERYLH
jgi:putative phosphoribosyl transferase